MVPFWGVVCPRYSKFHVSIAGGKITEVIPASEPAPAPKEGVKVIDGTNKMVSAVPPPRLPLPALNAGLEPKGGTRGQGPSKERIKARTVFKRIQAPASYPVRLCPSTSFRCSPSVPLLHILFLVCPICGPASYPPSRVPASCCPDSSTGTPTASSNGAAEPSSSWSVNENRENKEKKMF